MGITDFIGGRGEAIADPDGESIVDSLRLNAFAEQVSRALKMSPDPLQIAVVVGGGNILGSTRPSVVDGLGFERFGESAI